MYKKDFSHQQYEHLDWKEQEKTKLNSILNQYVIEKILLRKKDPNISIFDIGFGIGLFLQQLNETLPAHYQHIQLEGCEPSTKNFNYFVAKGLVPKEQVALKVFKESFNTVDTEILFDFLTASYVFPHFSFTELIETASKMYNMLLEKGKLVVVVANETYLREKLQTRSGLLIEESSQLYRGIAYKEIMHYSEIPGIGTIVDLNREEAFYLHLFQDVGFELILKDTLDDNGFICTVLVFQK